MKRVGSYLRLSSRVFQRKLSLKVDDSHPKPIVLVKGKLQWFLFLDHDSYAGYVNQLRKAWLNMSTLMKHMRTCLQFFSELCRGKAMVAYTKPQGWKKAESKRLRGERERSDQVY